MSSPPSYAATSVTSPRAQIESAELLSFTLDRMLIFPSGPPSVAMYELNRDPREGHGSIHEVRKLHYKLSSAGGEGVIRQSRSDLLYQIIPSRTPHYLYIAQRTEVLLFGKGSKSRRLGDVTMMPAWGSGNWKIPGFFKASRRLKNRFMDQVEIQWRDWGTGRLLAVESGMGKGDARHGRQTLPRLELKAELVDEKRDMLIACWVARLWREGI